MIYYLILTQNEGEEAYTEYARTSDETHAKFIRDALIQSGIPQKYVAITTLKKY